MVKNDFDVLDVNPASGYVSRNQKFETRVPEFGHYHFPLSLAHVAVDSISRMTASHQFVG